MENGKENRPYYEAYDERYKTVHEKGVCWFGGDPTAEVGKTIGRFGIGKDVPILEIGCGEGRDALPLLQAGYRVTATDISREAILYCHRHYPAYASTFRVLDCVRGTPPGKFGFVFAVAVLHMLTEDSDRAAFFDFVRECLMDDGVALIGSMGDGKTAFSTDPARAFDTVARDTPSGTMNVAATSCRIVKRETLEGEIKGANLALVSYRVAPVKGHFDKMMFAVVKRA